MDTLQPCKITGYVKAKKCKWENLNQDSCIPGVIFKWLAAHLYSPFMLWKTAKIVGDHMESLYSSHMKKRVHLFSNLRCYVWENNRKSFGPYQVLKLGQFKLWYTTYDILYIISIWVKSLNISSTVKRKHRHCWIAVNQQLVARALLSKVEGCNMMIFMWIWWILQTLRTELIFLFKLRVYTNLPKFIPFLDSGLANHRGCWSGDKINSFRAYEIHK